MNQKKKLSRKVISYALALMMVLSTFTGIVPFMDTSMTVKAEVADKTVAGLGTSAIINPTSTGSSATAWAGNYVYYGKYDGTSPTKYRVLDRASNDFGVDGGSLLLDCNMILYNTKFHDSNKAWSSSTLRSGLQGDAFLNKPDVFTEQEKGAIASSTKAGAAAGDGSGYSGYNYAALSADTVFVLDAKEVTRASYGYASNGTRIKSGASGSAWWLRSPCTNYAYGVGYVRNSKGTIDEYSHVKATYIGVSPAFNIKLSSVIFASAISGESGSYKLTLKDDKMNIALTTDKKVTKSGNTLAIPYTVSGDNSANATQVSVLVTDKAYTDSNVTILKYGKAADVSSSSLSGTGTFALPEGLTGTPGTDYHIYLLAEDVNGEKETDYANMKEITKDDIEVKPAQTVNPPEKATDLTYKKDQAQALLKSGASVDEGKGNTAEGSIKYKVGANGTWSTEIPTETNAGEYKVYYKVEGNDEYGEFVSTDEQAVSVTIAKADPETPEAFSAIYGQQAKDILLPTGWSWVEPEKKFESTGGVELKAKFAGNDNYNPKNNVSIYGTVAKAAAKISYAFTVVHKEYGSTSFTNEIENTGDVTPTYISSVTSVATVDGTGLVTIKGIGETTITANVAEDNDHYTYETRTASYKLIVNPVSTVISTAPKAADITYGQKLSESTLSGGVANVDGSEDTVAGKFAWKEPDTVPNASDNGEYDVVFTPNDTTNYAESTCNVKVKVNKAAAPETKESLSPEQKPAAKNADDLVYTGGPIELVTAPANPLGGYKVQYSKDNGTTWTDTIPTETNVDTYTVKVKYVSDNYENIDLDDITVEITPVSKEQLEKATKAASDYLATIEGKDNYSSVFTDLQKAIKAANDALEIENPTADQIGQAVKAINDAKTAAEKAVKAIDDEKAAKAVLEKIKALTPATEITPADRADIEAARKAYDDLKDEQKTKLAELDPNAVATLEAAEQALDTVEKAAFDDEKEVQKKAADALAADGDSDASKKLIEDVKKAINELAYDKSKSVDENKAALAAIVSKLKSDLTDNRAAEKKEADDTAAAKKVIDAINALPASNKVATTDKAAIEAARKAYDALTADQKKKVPADVLKKLTDAEAALKAATAADKAAKELVAAKEEAQAAMNEQVTVTQKGKKFTVKWKKSTSADGYYVYASYCGKKAAKPAKIIKKNTTTKATITKINGKKINQKKQFKVYVVPYKIIDGKNVILGKSTVAHVVGAKNTKYSNVKKLTLKKTKYSVKVGKTAKIKAKVTLVNKNKKHIPKGHGAKFRYKSSDTSIATVDKNGNIKGIKKGTCTIYVYSINGLMKKAKVTIK